MVKDDNMGSNSLFWWVGKEETEGDLVPYFQSTYKAVVGQC